MRYAQPVYPSLCLFALVTACSSPPAVTQEPSQNSADAGARPDAGATPEDAGVVAVDSGPELSLEVGRVELSRKSVLLEDFDVSAQLEAVVYNVDGVELPDAQVEWISGREGVVTVTDGLVAAVDRWGSAQVQARSGGVLSAPALVLVADPVEGALVVADDQVLGATPVDPEAELDIGWQYRVQLAGLNEQPQAGGYLISSGEAGISGRVVSVDQIDERTVVTMEAVAPRELFNRIEITERIKTEDLEYELNEELAEYFEVVELEDGMLRIRPLPHLTRFGSPASLVGEMMGSMGCKGTRTIPAVEVTGLVVDTRIKGVNLDFDYRDGRLNKLMLVGQMVSDISIPMTLRAAFEGGIKCKKMFTKHPIPVSPLGPLFGPAIEFGGGFTLTGRATLADVTLEPFTKISSSLGVGYRCEMGGSCGPVADFERNIESGINTGAGGLWDNDPEPMFEGTAKAFAYADLKFGARLPGTPIAAEFSAVEVEAGLKGQLTLMSIKRQVDDAMRSAGATFGAYYEGGIAVPFADKLEAWFGISASLARATQEWELARTPIGTVEQLTDQFPLVAGDPVELNIELTRPHHQFFGRNGAREIVVYWVDSTKPPERRFTEVAREPVGDGQTQFVIEWEPTVPQLQTREDQDGNEVLPWLHVFYVPNIPFAEGLNLELGPNAKIALGPGLGWTADAPVRVGGQIGSLRNSGAIDDQGRIGFCGTQQNGDRGAFIWSPGGGVVDMTGGRFPARNFGGCFIGNGTGIVASDTGAGYYLIREWATPGEQTIIGYGDGFHGYREVSFGAAIGWGNRNSQGATVFYTLDQSGGYDPYAGWDAATIRIARGTNLTTVAQQRGSLMLRPLMSDDGVVVWTDNNGAVRTSTGQRLGRGGAGLSPGISDTGGRIAWVEDGSIWLTSAANNWELIEIVNPAELELVGSVEADSRVGVGFAEGAAGRYAFVVFVGTNASGQSALFVAQIPDNTTDTEHVGVQALATAGEAIAGITPSSFHLFDPVSPEGHIVARTGEGFLRFMKN